MYIDGAWRAALGGGEFEITNPFNGAVIGSAPDGGQADAAAAIDAAAAAFPGWAGRTAYERSAFLYRAYAIMTERAEDLARTMTLEQGKPLRAAPLSPAAAAGCWMTGSTGGISTRPPC